MPKPPKNKKNPPVVISPRFALLGAAGYIAPRHMQAISDVGGKLVLAHDPHDAVGILDSFFPGAMYYKHAEFFEQDMAEYREGGTNAIDYVSICTPNYMHYPQIVNALRAGANVICEKPLVLHEVDLDDLKIYEEQTGKRVYSILQLRYCRQAEKLRKALANRKKTYEIHVQYSTPRGPWYAESWKSDTKKSGGLLTNIGIHIIDLFCSILGPVQKANIIAKFIGGLILALHFESATVTCCLSIDSHLPARRLIEIKGRKEMIDLQGFGNLHTICYREILAGRGLGIEDCREAVRVCDFLRVRNEYNR